MSIRIRNTGNLRDPNPHPDGDSGSYSRRHIIFKYFHVNFFSLGPIFHTLNPYTHAGRFGSAFNVWGSTLLNDIQNRHATLKATFIWRSSIDRTGIHVTVAAEVAVVIIVEQAQKLLLVYRHLAAWLCLGWDLCWFRLHYGGLFLWCRSDHKKSMLPTVLRTLFRIRIQGLKKRSNMFHNHDII